jgi:hypothetical protein
LTAEGYSDQSDKFDRLDKSVTRSSAHAGVSFSTSPPDASRIPAHEEEEEEMVDYKPSPTRENMDINMIYLYDVDYSLVGDDEVSQMDFDSRDVVF